MKTAAIQFVSEFGRPERNRLRLAGLVREAAGGGAQIVVLPELAIHGYMSEDGSTTWRRPRWPAMLPLAGIDPKEFAETIPGTSTEQFAALAAELKIYLTAPILERTATPPTPPFQGGEDGERLFNTTVLFGPDGELLLHYRKLNPWPYVESGWAAKGDRGLHAVETPFGRLGLLICYDIHFELPRVKAAGIDTLLFSSAWFDLPGSDFFRAELPRLAKEFEINVIAANWNVSKKQKWHGYGDSTIVDRSGNVIAQAKRRVGDQVVYGEL